MPSKVLVAYATVSGSTAEIASVIANELLSLGHTAVLLPMRKVLSLEGYQAVYLGTSLYMFHWHADTTNFLKRFKKPLQAGLPVAFFAGGPFHDDEKEFNDVRAMLDKTLAKYPWFHPAAVQVVGGRFDATKLAFPYNLILPMKKMPPSDVRDWVAIKAWAKDTAARLLPA